MASNVGKILKGIGGAWNNATSFTRDHPVIGTAATLLSGLNPITFGATVAGQFKDNKKSTSTNKKTGGSKTTYKSSVGDNVSYDGAGYGEGGYGGGGSYSSGVPDISALLAAYDQQADASRSIAQNAYDTTRNDLLTSLKRFQEQNAKDVQNQKQSYLSEQSNLDYAREQANRQNRVSASSRGLGGSGLQQLAQLQTLMGQSEDISQAALSNQKAMDSLRQALQQKEDETNTNLSKAQTTLSDALNKIEANLAQQKAEAIYQNQMAASSGGGGGSGVGYDSGFDSGLASLLNSFNAELATYGGKSEKNALAAINKAYGGTYGKAKDLNQAKTILGSVFADAVANTAGKSTSARALQNTINQGNAYISNLNSTKKKTTSKKKKK